MSHIDRKTFDEFAQFWGLDQHLDVDQLYDDITRYTATHHYAVTGGVAERLDVPHIISYAVLKQTKPELVSPIELVELNLEHPPIISPHSRLSANLIYQSEVNYMATVTNVAPIQYGDDLGRDQGVDFPCEKPITLYHITYGANVDAIMKDGLVQQEKETHVYNDGYIDKHSGIYLTNNVDTIKYVLSHNDNEVFLVEPEVRASGRAVLEVDVDPFTLRVDPNMRQRPVVSWLIDSVAPTAIREVERYADNGMTIGDVHAFREEIEWQLNALSNFGEAFEDDGVEHWLVDRGVTVSDWLREELSVLNLIDAMSDLEPAQITK